MRGGSSGGKHIKYDGEDDEEEDEDNGEDAGEDDTDDGYDEEDGCVIRRGEGVCVSEGER